MTLTAQPTAASSTPPPPAEPFVRKFLDISTDHLPERYRDEPLNSAPGVTAYELDHGSLMWVPDDPRESSAAEEVPVPVEILRIQLFARERGCDYVLFDGDADTIAGLPLGDDNGARYYVTSLDGSVTFAGPFVDQADADDAAEKVEEEQPGAVTDIRYEIRDVLSLDGRVDKRCRECGAEPNEVTTGCEGCDPEWQAFLRSRAN